jgi:hypothetical protein
VGYSQNLDGSMDYSKPLFSIPNPQQAISEVVIQYSNFVKASLQYLAGAADAERQTPSNPQPDMTRRSAGIQAQQYGMSSATAADATEGELLDQWVSSGMSNMGDHLSLFKVEPVGTSSLDVHFGTGIVPTVDSDKRAATVVKDGADSLQG